MSSAESETSQHKDPGTLTRFILAEQAKHKDATGDLTILLQSVQLACKVISNACRKAGIANLYGVAGGENTSGDQQKKLDVFSNECFINCLTFSKRVCLMVSEENEEPIRVPGVEHGKYFLAFDPLDGSSNIDANVSVGTIFSIFKKADDNPGCVEDYLLSGRQLCAAGYCLYGAATMLVLSTGNGVNGFTLDASLGEFILTHRDMRIPKGPGKIYSINEGNTSGFDEPTKRFVEYCKNPPQGVKAKSARYIGSMVADVHRTLLYGGIFCYPGTKKSPKGKLRYLYEGAPMAYLVEQAGGKASTGTMDIMDYVPTSIHDKTPIFLGSAPDVELVEQYYREHNNKAKGDDNESKSSE